MENCRRTGASTKKAASFRGQGGVTPFAQFRTANAEEVPGIAQRRTRRTGIEAPRIEG